MSFKRVSYLFENYKVKYTKIQLKEFPKAKAKTLRTKYINMEL